MQTGMPRRELEAALRRDPDDEQAWAVFGDLLAESGDSRGELIALEQRARASERPFERALLEHQARELFEREHRRWLGPLADAGLEVTWLRGFMREVVIARTHASTLEKLLELPTSALLRRVVLVRPRSLARVAKLLLACTHRPIEALVLRGYAGDSSSRPGDRADSLEPLASLDTLASLGIEGATLIDVASLAALPQLRVLALRRCEGPLHGLAGFTRLHALELSAHARVEQLGQDALTPLAALTELRELDLGDAGWANIEALAGLTALERLDLRSSETVRLEPLRELAALRELDLRGCTGLSDLGPLARLERLETLRLGYTRVRDLRPLAKLAKLTTLELAGTPITDLSPLFGLPALAKLDLKACEVADVRPLLARGVAVHGIRAPERTWRDIAEDHLRWK
jgi:uncharacterized protein (TIGR02996 family)